MNLNGATIDTQGFTMDYEQESLLESLIERLKATVPATELRLRLVRDDRLFEGMIWCEALGVPIGVYNRNTSFSQLTNSLLKKITKEYRRLRRISVTRSSSALPIESQGSYDLAG